MFFRNRVVLILVIALLVSSNCIQFASAEAIAQYDNYTSYLVDEPITFPDIVVTYKGEELEESHEKIKSSLFEVTSGSTTKRVVAPPLSMSGTLVRFGISFYRIFHQPGRKTISVRKGIW